MEITIKGPNADLTEALLKALPLTGIDIADRTFLHAKMEEYKVSDAVIYNGVPIVPYRVIDDIKRMRNSDDITEMSSSTYNLLASLFDFPHMNQKAYISYYNGSYSKMLQNLYLCHFNGYPDINRIADMLHEDRELRNYIVHVDEQEVSMW